MKGRERREIKKEDIKYIHIKHIKDLDFYIGLICIEKNKRYTEMSKG